MSSQADTLSGALAKWGPEHPFYPLYNALVNFRQGHVQPPSLYYVTRDDKLQLTVAAPITATTVQLSLRFMSAQGEILPRFEASLIGPTAGTPTVLTFENAEGYLLSASVVTPGAPRGQCFVSLAIKRGSGSADVTGGDILLQGYPGDVGGISYPTTPVRSPLDGQGRIRNIAVPAPAAGADFSQPVPPGVEWRFSMLNFTFATSAAVASRFPYILILDASGHVVSKNAGVISAPASTTATVSLGVWVANNFVNITGPPNLIDESEQMPLQARMQPGWSVVSETTGIDVADQYSGIFLAVEEFVVG